MAEKKKRPDNTLRISFRDTEYELKLKNDIQKVGESKFGMSAWVKDACAEKLYREGMPEYANKNVNQEVSQVNRNSSSNDFMDIDLGM